MRNEGFFAFILAATVLVALGWLIVDRLDQAQACSQRTCKTEHTAPRLNRYGECLCVEVAQ